MEEIHDLRNCGGNHNPALSTLTPRRAQRLCEVLLRRTRYCTLVVEDSAVPHNISAILRTCDGLGIQDVHIIEVHHQATIAPTIEKGSAQWLTLFHYQLRQWERVEVLQNLRSKGYRIVATDPHLSGAQSNPFDFDLDAAPFALLLGNELHGLSKEYLTEADTTIHLPLYGLVESYNISVAAAMLLYPLMERLRLSKVAWQLSLSEQQELLQHWATRRK